MKKRKAPRGNRRADYTNKYQGESITTPHDPSTTNHQDGDKESLKRRLNVAKAIARDMQAWISHRWGRLSEESTYSHPQLERSLKFTREVFDCGYEVLTVSSLVDGERGGEA
jgi:hypothetical protein